jgi:serine/threonine-protein kinase
MESSDRSEPTEAGGDELEELSPGDVIGERYRIERPLGTGGIGVVYRAVQLPLERPVAVKVLHDDLLTLAELRARFEREARVLSALTHPHVVSISDYGIDGERPFLVMELLEGRTLEPIVRGDPIDPERALHLGRQILRGLAFAHEKGIAHRDLKPANVFLQRMPDGTEHVKLLDFGLARVVAGEGDGDDEPTLTKRGVVFGTPAYMSPEQAAGATVDVSSDVYSAGVLLFELLAGRRPFLGETRAELLRAHLSAPVPRIASVRPELRLHPDLVQLLDVAMAKEPGERFVDARDMLAALDAIEPPAAWLVPDHEVSSAPTQIAGAPADERPAGRRIGWLAGGLVVALGLGGALAVALWPSEAPTPAPPPPEAPAAAREPATPEGPAARDPWAEPPPEPLRPYLEMVREGHVFEDRGEIRPLYGLAHEMPEDPRPLLLLGHLFVAKGWYTEGIRRFELAARIDPSVRGDRRMLEALVELAARESVGDRASRAIRAIYGAEALPAVESAVERYADEPLSQLRLVRLRDELRASS